MEDSSQFLELHLDTFKSAYVIFVETNAEQSANWRVRPPIVCSLCLAHTNAQVTANRKAPELHMSYVIRWNFLVRVVSYKSQAQMAKTNELEKELYLPFGSCETLFWSTVSFVGDPLRRLPAPVSLFFVLMDLFLGSSKSDCKETFRTRYPDYSLLKICSSYIADLSIIHRV